MSDWKNSYICLKNNIFYYGDYSIVPIRFNDRYKIMSWRNDQIDHLRQKNLLKKADQDNYFNSVVKNLFNQKKPNQILFSFLDGQECIGYGGLVHIDWVKKDAEISFVINTDYNTRSFIFLWECFLSIIKKVAFTELSFNKIYTYSYNIRPNLYLALENSGFCFEEKKPIQKKINNKYYDILVHSFFNPIPGLKSRFANKKDMTTYLKWKNDPEVIKNSILSSAIPLEVHKNWFDKKLKDENTKLFIYENKNKTAVGQVRLEKYNSYWNIDYSIDKIYRGLGLGKILLDTIIKKMESEKFLARVKNSNKPSIKIFENLGFKKISNQNGILVYKRN